MSERKASAVLPTADRSALEELRAAVRGDVLEPGDNGYEAARKIWNGMIDKRPALIVRCSGVADVLAAVKVARERGLLVAVRGGGHNWAGLAACDDGILIDLSPMKGILIDPEARTARVQGGATWGDLDHECQPFGLAVTGGHITTTGIAGLTLGGGIGWLCRKLGLTVDNLLAVDLVTADGRFVRCSADEHADLFWGVCGGGGNFGIATSFTFRLHPVDTVVGGLAFWPADRAADLLRFYRRYLESVPGELTTLVAFLVGPPAPFLPKSMHGVPLVAVGTCYAGDTAQGMRAVQPIKEFGPPGADLIGPMPYQIHQALLDPILPPGLRYYVKSVYLDELGDDAIDALVEHSARMSSPLSLTTLQHYGGAVSRVDADATAYAYRNAAFAVTMGAAWTDAGEDDRHIAWSRDFYASMLPLSHGVYVNFMGMGEGEDRVREAYGAKTYDRLVALKNRYDPTNLFRVNHNIRPTV
ncbi:MAG TPA: FAD-binding oxidoreductase [Chloroflexota bacterium]|nr:FAD-binding oxidoreductase [Chloroflexota bacterium]